MSPSWPAEFVTPNFAFLGLVPRINGAGLALRVAERSAGVVALWNSHGERTPWILGTRPRKAAVGDRARCIPANRPTNPNPFNALQNNQRHHRLGAETARIIDLTSPHRKGRKASDQCGGGGRSSG